MGRGVRGVIGVLAATLATALAATGMVGAPTSAAASTKPHAAGTPSPASGRPGYAMGAPTPAAAGATGAPLINASYTHTPAPGAQTDLPPLSGPTMHTLTVYEVFWLPSGHFGASTADDTTYENLLERWAADINASPYYNVVTQYYDPSNGNTHITSTASFGGAFVDTATAFPHAGTTTSPLSDADIRAEVNHAAATQGWVQDINHVVAVFTPNGTFECDAGGKVDGHCTFPVTPSHNGSFCAYHNHFTNGANDAVYAYMSYDDMSHGTGVTCDAGDTGNDNDPNRHVYPNGSKSADAEVSTFSHEIIEAVTDPHPNLAWTALDGEIGDKCNYNYAPRNDQGADVYINGHPYILQQEWSNAVHTCAIDLVGSGVGPPTVGFAKSVADANPAVTRSATYTVTLNNTNDTGAAANLAFSDSLPSGYAVTNVSAPGNTSLTNTASTVSVNYDTLPVHQSRTITITATVPGPAGTLATNCGGLTLQNLLGSALSPLTTSPCANTTPKLIPTTLTNAGPVAQGFDEPATVSAKLVDDLANPLAGQTVTFTLNGVETCNAPTNGTGIASCQLVPGESPGTYSLGASVAATSTYGATSVSTTFSVTPPIADFNGDGSTDIGIWRPPVGGWYLNGQPTTFLGLSGDIPVPGDYNGDGKVEQAVYRPAVGGWYIAGQPTVFFGLPGDIPVPGDYNGDGKTDIAIFRPSVGGWYINGQPTVFFGLNGDVPVPADYNGDGTTDIAVYRPSVGGWYINGQPTVFFGLSTDTPVPGDYNHDGKADIAVFRDGAWLVNGQATVFLGLAGDIPVPGDYNGDGTTDIAIFRPSVGGWYINGQPTVFYGLNGDVPTPKRPGS